MKMLKSLVWETLPILIMFATDIVKLVRKFNSLIRFSGYFFSICCLYAFGVSEALQMRDTWRYKVV